jgi:hypothetical protein
MTKIKQVDVGSSVMWNKENGRIKPADQTEVGSVSKRIKVFVCPKCNIRVEKSHLVFGEALRCNKCGGSLKEVTA